MKDNYARIVALVLCMLMLGLCAVGCSGKPNTNANTTAPNASETVITDEQGLEQTTENVTEDVVTQGTVTEEPTTEEPTTEEATTEEITTEAQYPLEYEVYSSSLSDIMQNMFEVFH